MSSSGGTKVTTDPESTQKPIQEGAGTVTSDSLAAQSHNEGGGFTETPGPQPSASTTTNTTDTANATELPPAPDSATRAKQTGELDEQYTGPPPGGKEAGVGPTYNTPGGGASNNAKESGGSGNTQSGGTSDNTESGGTSGTMTAASGGASGDDATGVAGGSGAAVGDSVPAGTASIPAQHMKPKGKNITEGGFDGDEPNASFNNEVGTENDPGRSALNRMQRVTQESAVDAAAPTRQKEVQTGTGEYDALEETSA